MQGRPAGHTRPMADACAPARLRRPPLSFLVAAATGRVATPPSPQGHCPGRLDSAGHRALGARSPRDGAAPGAPRRREDGVYAVIKVPDPIDSARRRNDHAETGWGVSTPGRNASNRDSSAKGLLNHMQCSSCLPLPLTRYNSYLMCSALRNRLYLSPGANTEEKVCTRTIHPPRVKVLENFKNIFPRVRFPGCRPAPGFYPLRTS